MAQSILSGLNRNLAKPFGKRQEYQYQREGEIFR